MVGSRIKEIINYEGIDIKRKYQLVTLEILLEVDRICRSNGLTYWMDSGTLLGSVRHKGFIPWDDDIDICMPRKDYNKFRTIIKDELDSQLVFEDKSTKYWVQPNNDIKQNWLKIYYLNGFKSIDTVKGSELIGTFIDVFPVDEVDESMIYRKSSYVLSKILGVTMKENKGIKCKVKKFLQDINIENIWIQRSNRLSKKGKANYITYGIETEFLNSKYLHKKEDVYPLVELEFEGYKLFAPNNYKQYLTNMYGDFMKEVEYPTHCENLEIVI